MMHRLWHLDVLIAVIKTVGKDNKCGVTHWLDAWDFQNENTNLYTHKIHKYPATFIPQLVKKLLLEYSAQGDTVLGVQVYSTHTTAE